MTPGDLIWMFFVFSALQPALKQRFLEASRQRLIAKIERQRKSRVILLVHRQGPDRLPLRQDVEGQAGLERQDHRDPPAVGQTEDPPSGRGGP